MANNRIYLRCRGCGETLFLGKSYLGGFYYENYHPEKSLEEKLNAFYERHNYCDNERVTGRQHYDERAFPMPDDCSGCDGCFDVVYEDAVYAGYADPEET